MDAQVTFKVVAGPQAGREFAFNAHDTFTFGRSAECRCSLPGDPYISAKHFLVEVNPPDCELRDLGSKNGTRVNGVACGQRVKGEAPELAAQRARPVPLRDGDVIKAGISEFKVCVRVQKETRSLAEEHEAVKAAPEPEPQAGFMTNLFAGVKKRVGEEALPEFKGFKTEKALKEGGMGKVYLVRRLEDGGKAVIKVIKPASDKASEKQVKLFQREMLLDMGLKHPNIVAFQGSGLADKEFFFVMEFCPAGSVRELMTRSGERLEVGPALDVMLQALDGLAYAHGQDVVHRDLKPDNILLVEDEGRLVAKVADFGLAKNFALSGLSSFTLSGEYAGTYQYMPKEQIERYRDCRPVTDVFAMGATLYHMLTGKYVYDFDKVKDYMVPVLNSAVVPIRKRGTGLPPALADAIDRAIEPDAAKRTQTAARFKADLMKAVGR